MSTSEDSKSFEQAIRDAERKSVMAVVAPALRNATDLLSEQLANSDDEHAKYLLKVNRALWQARWSLGVLPEDDADAESALAGAAANVAIEAGGRS